jgi:RNA polymerase sigma-70 factor (ECF subfamily)
MEGPPGATTAPNKPLTGLHDVELAQLAMASDRQAFGELVRRHGSSVRALLRRMGADGALADDLAQDAFLAAFESIADFRGEGAFAGWVKRIAARLYIKRWRRRAELDPAPEAPELADDTVPEGLADSRLDLDQALKTLSAAEQLYVSLCYGAGLSHAEAAEATGAPLGTVKSHVKRALEKLKRQLAPDGNGRALETDTGRPAHG